MMMDVKRLIVSEALVTILNDQKMLSQANKLLIHIYDNKTITRNILNSAEIIKDFVLKFTVNFSEKRNSVWFKKNLNQML